MSTMTTGSESTVFYHTHPGKQYPNTNGQPQLNRHANTIPLHTQATKPSHALVQDNISSADTYDESTQFNQETSHLQNPSTTSQPLYHNNSQFPYQYYPSPSSTSSDLTQMYPPYYNYSYPTSQTLSYNSQQPATNIPNGNSNYRPHFRPGRRENGSFQNSQDRQSGAGSSFGGTGSMTNVYIRGLPTNTTDESLYNMCKAYGVIVSSKSIIDPRTGQCKGYGFVMYESIEDCKNAIDGLNKTGYQSSFAKESMSGKLKNLQDPSSTNIYISNLPLDCDEKALENLFTPFKILSTRILRDSNNVSRGVGFARMSDRETALAVIQKFNHTNLPNSSSPLQVRFADSVAQKKLKNQVSRRRIMMSGGGMMMPGAPDMGFQGYRNPMLQGMPMVGMPMGLAQQRPPSPGEPSPAAGTFPPQYMQPPYYPPAHGVSHYQVYYPVHPQPHVPPANGDHIESKPSHEDSPTTDEDLAQLANGLTITSDETVENRQDN
ncbi:hypothetical protein BKA69DRAFT_1078987 [Paraphysoderma sedebokerense]|nr:hypothetical protein BKA69DRAFT_1078987 [Paraphysoderma sedebokerense]